MTWPYHNQSVSGPAEVAAMLSEVLAAEDGQAQLVIVNNRVAPGLPTLEEDWLDAEAARRGWIVLHRPNAGGSFAAFDHAYRRLRSRFAWWLLTEDDIVVGGADYFARLIERYQREPRCGFLALVGVYDRRPVHAHGAIGLTHRSVLERVLHARGSLPHPTGCGWERRRIELEGEVAFTNAIYSLGYRLVPFGPDGWNQENLCLPYWNLKQPPP